MIFSTDEMDSEFIKTPAFFALILCLVAFTFTILIFMGLRGGALGLLFLAWNLSPGILALMILGASLYYSAIPRLLGVGFCSGVSSYIFLINFIYINDIGGALSGSSTSSLMFIFLPFYAVVPGLIGGVLGVIFEIIFKDKISVRFNLTTIIFLLLVIALSFVFFGGQVFFENKSKGEKSVTLEEQSKQPSTMTY